MEEEKKDMAICFVLFNPTQSKRLVMNALFVKNMFEVQGLPCYTLELVYEGHQPELPYAFHVSGSSILFHKENLCRILETKIPDHFTKLAFLDADVTFSNPHWYQKTSELLNTFDVVHPFEHCVWLDLTYREELLRRKTIVLGPKEFSEEYHPGFAWCMRRDWYKEQGFFDLAVCGNGDSLSATAWLQKDFSIYFMSVPFTIWSKYLQFYKKPPPRITYLKDTLLYHLFHGSRENRKYIYRNNLLRTNMLQQNYVKPNTDGVFEWIDKQKWNPIFLHYFQQREDDALSLPIKVVQS